MGNQFWTGDSTSKYSAPLNALLIGIADASPLNSTSENPKPIPGDGETELQTGHTDVAAQAIVGLNIPILPGAGPKYGDDFSNLYDFGTMRSAGLAYNAKRYRETDANAGDEGINYIKGPWFVLQDELSAGWGGSSGIALARTMERPAGYEFGNTSLTLKQNDFNLANRPVYGDIMDTLVAKAASIIEQVFGSNSNGTFSESWAAVSGASAITGPTLPANPMVAVTGDDPIPAIAEAIMPDASEMIEETDWDPPTGEDAIDTDVDWSEPASQDIVTDVDWAAPTGEDAIDTDVDWSEPADEDVDTTVDWAAPTGESAIDTEIDWTAPTSQEIETDVDWASPVVDIDADITAAVSAREAIEEIFAAQEKASITAQHFGTRSLLSDQIAQQLQTVDDRMALRLADYEQSLRMNALNLKFDALLKLEEMKRQKATEEMRARTDATLRVSAMGLEKSTKEADSRVSMGIRFSELEYQKASEEMKTGADLLVRFSGMSLEKAMSEMQSRVSTGVRFSELNHQMLTDEMKALLDATLRISDMGLQKSAKETDARVNTGLRLSELAMQKATTDARLTTETNVTRAKMTVDQKMALNQLLLALWNAKVDVVKSGWEAQLRAKVDILVSSFQYTLAAFGSGDAVARVLTSMVQADLQESMFRRSQEAEWKRFGLESANAISNAVVAMADARSKSMMQNLNVLRDAVSTFSAAPAYVQERPSPFQNTMNALGGVSSLVSAGMNIGVALH